LLAPARINAQVGSGRTCHNHPQTDNQLRIFFTCALAVKILLPRRNMCIRVMGILHPNIKISIATH